MRRRVVVGAGLAAVLGAAAWLGLGGSELLRRRRPNLLLVSLDTTRADRIGCYGYPQARTPRLDALAANGLRFSQATTVAPLTLPAHASLMTGSFPAAHGVRDNGGFYLGEDRVTLAEWLRERGYRTGGFIGAFVLDRRWGIAQGFDRYFDDFDLSKFEGGGGMDSVQRRGDEVVARALEWLDAVGVSPFFAWVHLYDPHTPYAAPEPFAGRFPRTPSGAYDAEIAWTDSLVGRLVDRLAAERRLDRTVVVVVGDHGEALGGHREQTHGFFVYDETIHVPLILAGPGVGRGVVRDPVRIVDVLPTVLELLGVPPLPQAQGTSLLPLARGERRDLPALAESWYPRYHYGWSELVAFREGRYKLIRAPRRELYDLEADPRETRNLAEAEPQRADALAASLEGFLTRFSREEAARGPQAIDSETAERLQALGYVASGASPRHLEERPRGDPKDKIDLYNQLRKAGTASAEGRIEDAVALVEQALRRDPEIVEGHMLLGNFQRKAGRPKAAVAAYRAALGIDPEHQGALYNLAVTYKTMGRFDDARTGFERARELDPRNGRVVWQLADLDMQQHRLADAETLLEQAIARGVDVPRFRLKLGECYIEMKRWAQAEAALREAIRLQPEIKTAHYNLALVREEQGDVEAAIAEYEVELGFNPQAFRASFNLGRLLQGRGRLAEAVTRFRESLEHSPDFAVGRLYLAKALLDSGDLPGAEAAARRGLVGNPERSVAPLGHYVLADVYARLGRPQDAAREVATAHRLESGG